MEKIFSTYIFTTNADFLAKEGWKKSLVHIFLPLMQTSLLKRDIENVWI